MKEYKTGFLVGRFQILHLGHQEIIEQAINKCNKVIVLVGSADKSRTNNNPFTYDERKEMLETIFQDKIIVAPLNDIGVGNVYSWGDYLYKYVINLDSNVEVFFTGSEIKTNLWFRKEIQDRLKIVSIDKGIINISASKLRLALLDDDYSLFSKYVDKRLLKNYLKYQSVIRESQKEDIKY